MKVAVPDWQGRVSPVFDVAEQIRLVDLEDQGDGGHAEILGSTAPHQRARRMTELGVDVLICGAISWPLEALLVAQGIRVIPLICGEVADVVRAFLDGTLGDQHFAMPGGCRKRRQARHRRRRCDGLSDEEIP